MSSALITIITSTISFIIGIFLDRFFESKARLIAYYGHAAAGRVRIDNSAPAININTHSIVITNTGRKPALNVRVGHYPVVSNVQNMIAIHPAQRFVVEPVTDMGEEIVFERLLPKQSINITYIYAGLLANQITAYVRSDEGEAKFLPVIISRQYTPLVLNLLRVFVFIGFVTTVFYVYLYGKEFLVYMNWLG